MTPARLKPNQLRPFRRRSQIAFNNIRCRKALLQDHTNNRRSHPEKAFNLHLPHLTCGAARLGGYLAELEALEINQASGYVRVEGAKMTTSWLRQGGKMPPSGVARAQVQPIFRSHRASIVDGSAHKPYEIRAFLAAPALACKPSASRRQNISSTPDRLNVIFPA